MSKMLKDARPAPTLHHHDDHCGCGHLHHDHHEKQQHCDCGHEHTAHHEHDHESHAEECGCGCGHHHEEAHCCEDDDGQGDEEEHHHGHDHCHGHEHEKHEHKHEHETHEHREAMDSAHLQKQVYRLENLGCAHCAAQMEEKINRLPQVGSATITYATKQLRIAAENPDALLGDIQAICTSIESAVQVVPQQDSVAKKATDSAAVPARKKLSEDKRELIEIITGAVLFAAAVLFHNLPVSGGDTPVLILTMIAYIILGGKVLLEAFHNIRNGRIFDENFLMGIATLGAFFIAEYLEAVGVMLFYRVGEYFEHRAVDRSRNQIMDAVDMRPEVVNLSENGTVRTIDAKEAKPGQTLLIRPGDRIPLDGIILNGESRLDTSPITGEPVPVSVTAGDRVLSGCLNTSGQLLLQVEKPLSESMVTKILDSVENAAAGKPKIDRFITRFSRIYTPVVVAAALLVAIVPSLITGNWSYWVYTALTFLVMSCPCALVLSVPLAFFSGIGAGSKKGILFKGGVSMEALAKIKAVIMDKTGTITEGNFKLQKIVPFDKLTETEMLALAAGCEQNSTHPIAASITAAAKERGLSIEAPTVLKEIAGHGIQADTSRGTVLCGNRKLLEKFRIAIPNLGEAFPGAEVFLAVDGRFAGLLMISDTLKADAKSGVSKLKSLGLHTVMLTGDSEESAESVAQAVGIDQVHAKLLPQDKLDMLSQIRKEKGAVLFVGDGINDAPVLAGADVGAAMGSGADAAIEAADAVFMHSGVEAIADSITIARKTGKIAMENVVFALLIKAIVMVLGLVGFANMWLAVFADSGVAMLCVLNSIRILYRK